MGERTRKLLTLRTKTDHDLLVLVNRELDRAYGLVNVATTRNLPLFVQAERALATATTMLPRISGLSTDDCQRIEAKVKQLRSGWMKYQPMPTCGPTRRRSHRRDRLIPSSPNPPLPRESD